MRLDPREFWSFLRESYERFNQDDCRLMAGAMAYYMLFALPVVFMLSVYIAGLFFGWEDAEARLKIEAQQILGEAGAEQVGTIMEHTGEQARGFTFSAIVAIGALFFGAVRAFEQFQIALNRVWSVDIAPEKRDWRMALRRRVFSFCVVWAVIAILSVSLAVNILLVKLGERAVAGLGNDTASMLAHVGDYAVTFAIVTLLLTVLFKILPDAHVAWRDVWFGALVTALLFVTARTLLGYFLGRSDFGDVYGAASSLAILLIWIYSSSLILLFGAEMTQVWARRQGSRVEPAAHAVEVSTEVRRAGK